MRKNKLSTYCKTAKIVLIADVRKINTPVRTKQ